MEASEALALLTDLRGSAKAVAKHDLTCAELIEAALNKASQVDPQIHAFAWLDRERTLRAADAVDASAAAGRTLGALHGVPIAVKDIFDTAGIPTECGTATMTGRIPQSSATAVRAIETAGGVLFGKTVTAELAYFTPGPTLNPWNLLRTPGGSSMGSAAVVAAGIVPGAIGTQTNGSVIRPAAFCGVVGFKPSAGAVSTKGVMPFSPTLDQVGCFANTVSDVSLLSDVLRQHRPDSWSELIPVRNPRIGAVPGGWEMPDPDAQERFESDLRVLQSAGAEIVRLGLPSSLESSPPIHRTIMAFEASVALAGLVHTTPWKLSAPLMSLLIEGSTTESTTYRLAIERRKGLIREFVSWSKPFDAIATPPAAGEAPTTETTGDPRFCTRWTLLGAPCVVIPTGVGRNGLPLGLQLVGRPDRDLQLLSTAAWAETITGSQRLAPPPLGDRVR